MNPPPFFSIITCTYNPGACVSACIASVEDQGFRDYEHLFIDGFSTDSSPEIIGNYAARDPERVQVYRSPAQGVTRAMNEGIERARGEVILHLHGDDKLYDEGVLARVHALFIKHGPALVVGNCQLTGHATVSRTWPENRLARFVTRNWMPVMMFLTNPIAHPSTYVSKGVFERNGKFDEKYRVVMDYEFWFRILRREKIRTTDDLLSVYHFHADTISTRQMELGLKEIDEIRRKYRFSYPLSYLMSLFFLRPVLFVRRVFVSMLK